MTRMMTYLSPAAQGVQEAERVVPQAVQIAQRRKQDIQSPQVKLQLTT